MENSMFYGTLGANIRMHRKQQRITQKELAQRINKTLACVSKYENGSISLDVYTLFEIADALGVDPQQLLPGRPEAAPAPGPVPEPTANAPLPALFRDGRLWGYNFRDRRTLAAHCLEVNPDTLEATLYMDCRDPGDPASFQYVMPGTVQSQGMNLKIYCTNPLLSGDFMMLCFNHADLLLNRNVGLCVTMTPTYQFRTMKFYLSRTPVRDRELLGQMLAFTKEELTYAKKNDSFVF